MSNKIARDRKINSTLIIVIKQTGRYLVFVRKPIEFKYQSVWKWPTILDKRGRVI